MEVDLPPPCGTGPRSCTAYLLQKYICMYIRIKTTESNINDELFYVKTVQQWKTA